MGKGKGFFLLTLASTACASAFAGAIVIYELNVFSGLDKLSFARLWCDGCFISAVFFLGAGILVAVKRNGGFDSINYAFSQLAKRFWRPAKNSADKKNQSYLEYVRQRHADGKKSPHPAIMISGGIMLLASFILLALA